MSEFSVAPAPTGLSKTGEELSISSLKFSHPSLSPSPAKALTGTSPTIFLQAASISSGTPSSSMETIIFNFALSIRYAISLALSIWVAGIATAPILWSPTIAIQKSYLPLRVSITASPFPTP